MRDALVALRAETVPTPAHQRPGELASCWDEVFKDLKKLEAAFLFHEKLADALAAAPHNLRAARRVRSLQRKAEQLRVEALGAASWTATGGRRKARWPAR